MAKPPRKSGQRVSLTPATVKRIARCVLAFERGSKDMPALPMRTGDGDDALVRGTFTGPWAQNATLTVTDSILSSVTYPSVKNYLTPITGTGTKNCLIAYVGGEWVLVSFDLTQLDGYSSSKSQVLGTVSGALRWIDTTACT
jgi:hypothetical protein